MAGTVPAAAAEVAPGVFRVRDTCNVYVLRTGREATLVDFGSGGVLDRLDGLEVERVTDVLVTHHHRDQVQGLARAAEAGIRIWVPPVEVELIADVDRHWQSRQVDDDYDLRQDRFSLLEQVAVTGTVDEYRTRRYGGVEAYTLPTPGHTLGSVTYVAEAGGRRLAFTGDLLYGDGKVWSLAATQWTYTGVAGQAASILSCHLVEDLAADLLLPAHGEPIEAPAPALARTRRRLQELMELRRELDEPWDLESWLRDPWEELTPHLLRNRTSFAASYALLSDSGGALLLDWGYDQCTGFDLPSDRAGRRPLLTSLEALRRDHGVERVEAAIPTHYHDDHVAGLNLLREVEGTEVWAPANVAPVLEEPHRYDLPCLWFDPIRVDRRLPFGVPIAWREHELTLYPLPGHTLYAAAIAFSVDGQRVLATGDQQSAEPSGRSILNYQYRNRFRIDDFVASAELYRALRPDLIVCGHWPPRAVDDAYLDRLAADARQVADLHRELLPLEEVDFGAEGGGARIEPYRSRVAAGETVELAVTVRNPFGWDEEARVQLAASAGWRVTPAEETLFVAGRGEAVVRFVVEPARQPVRRARVAADLTVGGVTFGQQAEALVDVTT
jgi:glyoxylase-like metal-dependent hydrolase (beta-lactamase superfamily II)